MLVIALAGVLLLFNGGYIHLKAALGQYLVHQAWQRSLDTGELVKPWNWADTWPVARLQVPDLGVDQIVLAGDSGQSLAFGPGHSIASAPPGGPGATVISGHRDTHFGFLKQLRYGQAITLQDAHGAITEYRISRMAIIDTRTDTLSVQQAHTTLVLATCWPFDGIQPNTPWRYLVVAEAVSPGQAVPGGKGHA